MKKKTITPSPGSRGFPKEYWEKNYETPEEMDNIINAREHAAYMRAIFALEAVDINSIIDLGFGLGILFEEVLKTFFPYRAYGIEPSQFIFDQVKARGIAPVESTKLTLENIDLISWAKRNEKRPRTYDLGICTSVLQYLNDQELEIVIPVLAQRVRYLYLSVPTDLELKQQIEDVKFFDEYAIHRSREKYLELISPHFTFISSRLLESKFHAEESPVSFSDLLFRF